MSLLKNLILTLTAFFLISACSNSPSERWMELVSTETSFIIVPQQNATVGSVLQSDFIPVLDDVTSSAIQMASRIDSIAGSSLNVESLFLYPGANRKLQPIWVIDADEDLKDKMLEQYSQTFSQNEYGFEGTTILNLLIDDRRVFVASVNDLILLSESSIGIEKSIRAYRGADPVADLSGLAIEPGSFVINTPELNRWLAQLGEVSYGPVFKNAFKGTKPAVLRLNQTEDEEKKLQLAGEVGIGSSDPSPLIRSVSATPKPITLDEYISSDAAAFGIFHVPAVDEVNETIPDTTSADAFLLNNGSELMALTRTLDSELGMVMFTKSGFLSEGEHLFIRKVTDADELRTKLDEMVNRNLVENVDDAYFIQSNLINQAMGAGLSNFRDFYIKISGDAAIISKRKGLAEKVSSDRERRRVITYEQYYEKLKESLPETISSTFVAGPDFYSFLEPFLADENYVDALTSGFDYIAISTQLNGNGDAFSFDLSTYTIEGQDEPFRQNWSYSTGGAELSGKPVIGDVGGNLNDEIVFATETGSVYILAGDGSFVQQYNTGRDVPVGSPVIYDWYGTGQNIVLIAAGNKIYGWDESGNTLPKFPLELSEQITTPLVVADVNDNKLPDAILATADRKLHVLNGRGNNLQGWPVTTNSRITSAPRVDYVNGQLSVVAFSSNAVHAWNTNGNTLQNFPTFAGASLKGSPAIHDDYIFGNAVDGNLYAVGESTLFADSLNNSSSSSENVHSVYVTSGSLAGSPSIQNLTVTTGDNNYEDTMILTTSSNGSVFLLNLDGRLQFSKNMGQPISEESPSFITDINSDGSSDVVALANYGRLYAWNIENGERIFDLPTTSISHMNIVDIDGDGLKEIIAQTENGVQSWTINR